MFWRRKKGADGEAAGAPGGAAAKGPRIDLNKVSKQESSTQLRALLYRSPSPFPLAPYPTTRILPTSQQPRWDQGTFEGRARHFFTTTNPLNVLASDDELDKAKALVEAYK